MNRFKEENYEYILKRKKSYFGPTTCSEATYDCRVKKQYMQIMFETNKLKQLFNRVHEKFLKAIDHMEFHPTLGKEKKETSFRLHKHNAKDREASMAHQMRYLSPDDIQMLKQGNEIIQKISKGKQHKALNKEIWSGYLDFRLGSIQECTKSYGH